MPPLLRRALGFAILLVIGTATSCIAVSALSLSPSPRTSEDLAGSVAFPLVERVVARRELTPSPSENRADPSMRCFARETLFLCGRVRAGHVEFYFRQGMTTRFRPWADSVRREVRDSLRARFGDTAVRECSGTSECPQ